MSRVEAVGVEIGLRTAISILADGNSLSSLEAEQVASALLNPGVSEVLVSGVLVALRVKGESPEEIVGFARALRRASIKVPIDGDPLLDTAGTGGDGAGTINVSTAAAIVASSGGVSVAKHGNRSVSSVSGSADLMESLGYNINHGPREAACIFSKTKFTFLFAPRYHPAMRNVMPVRRELGLRTIFNLVGPLSNPATVSHQVIGVAHESLLEKIAMSASTLGYKRALVVHGEPGIDEISVSGRTTIYEVRRGNIEKYHVGPEDLGLSTRPIGDLKISSPQEGVSRVSSALQGQGRPGDVEFIAANAGAALYAAGTVSDIRDGVELALQLLGEGKPYEKLLQVVQSSRSCMGLEG